MKWIIAAFILFSSPNLLAQTPDSRGWVFGGIAVPWQQGVTSDEYRTYLAAPGGWAPGLLIGGGARIKRFFSITAEWHRTGLFEAVEPSRYAITYSARRRDTMLGAGGRFHVPVGRMALEPVALVEFVHEESWLAQRHDAIPGSGTEGDLSDYSPFVNSWGTGLVAGADLRVGSGHFAILPGLRVHRFWRDAEEGASSTWPGGVSKWSVECTVGLRADF